MNYDKTISNKAWIRIIKSNVLLSWVIQSKHKLTTNRYTWKFTKAIEFGKKYSK